MILHDTTILAQHDATILKNSLWARVLYGWDLVMIRLHWSLGGDAVIHATCLLNIFLRWHGIDWATYRSEPLFPPPKKKNMWREIRHDLFSIILQLNQSISLLNSPVHLCFGILGLTVFFVCKALLPEQDLQRWKTHLCLCGDCFGVEFTREFPKKVGKRLQKVWNCLVSILCHTL